MNKQQGYLAIWFIVVFVIQGFRMYDPNVPYETFLNEEHSKYPEITEENINAIITLAEKNVQTFPKINRKEFIMFFHSANFNVQKAYDMIVKHYDFRKKLPEIFDSNDKDPELNELNEVKKVMSYSILFSDSYTREGDRYIYTHFIDTNPQKFDFIQNVRYVFFMIKCLLIHYGTFNGLVVIINAKGFTKKHIAQFKLFVGKTVLQFIQDAPPLRIKKIYILNSNRSVEYFFYSVIWLFLTREFINKIVFCYPNSTKVYKEVPRTIMPREYYEGEGPSYTDQASQTYERMENFHNKYGPNSEDDLQCTETEQNDVVTAADP